MMHNIKSIDRFDDLKSSIGTTLVLSFLEWTFHSSRGRESIESMINRSMLFNDFKHSFIVSVMVSPIFMAAKCKVDGLLEKWTSKGFN